MIKVFSIVAMILFALSLQAKEFRWFDVWSLETVDGVTTLSTKALEVPGPPPYDGSFEFQISCTWEGPVEIKVVFLNDEFEFHESVIELGGVGGKTMLSNVDGRHLWARRWSQWWGISESRGRPAIVHLEPELLLDHIVNNPNALYLTVKITVQEFRKLRPDEIQKRLLDVTSMGETYEEMLKEQNELWLKANKDKMKTIYREFRTGYELYEKEQAIAAMWSRCRKEDAILD